MEKTKREIKYRKQCFLNYVFPCGFGNDPHKDYARKAWQATTVRGNPIYNPGTSSQCRYHFGEHGREQVKTIVEDIIASDCGFISSAKNATADMSADARADTAFIRRVKKLRDGVTNGHHRILDGERLRFGRAQKLLNMYFKYMWCADEISPPHCPFDNIIIKRLVADGGFGEERGSMARLQGRDGHENVRHWTKSDNPDDYRAWLVAARRIAEGKYRSLSEWELVMFSEEVCNRPEHKGTCLCGKGCYREKGC